MSNLLASFTSAANTLNVLAQALQVTQNNVNNSQTPGYARQTMRLESQPLDVASGLAGGVLSGGLEDSRNVWAEEQVQSQTSVLGLYTAQAQSTSSLQASFDVTGTGGVTAALSGLLQNFSAWATTPSDSTARQNVLNGAQNVAQAINTLTNSISQSAGQLNLNAGNTVDQINSITAQIQQYNTDRRGKLQSDPGSEAQLYGYLQDLSALTNFTSVRQTDGTMTVLMSGGAPLVVGTEQYKIETATTADGVQVLDNTGKDITAQATGGQLGGLLDARNRVLTSIVGSTTTQGSLNQFAQTLADTVNNLLTTGTTSSDPGAPNGAALFTYDNANLTQAAATFAVNPGIAAADLAPVDAAGNANGNANQLAALGSSTATQAALGGMTLLGYFGQIAANAGRENSAATSNQATQEQVVAQAKNLRDQASGVNLDQEAVSVLQFQRAYQAAARVLTTLDTLSDTVLNMIRQ